MSAWWSIHSGFVKISGEGVEHQVGTCHPSTRVGRVRDAADCLRKGVWVHIGVGTAEHIFDREGMTSVVFPRLGYYTHR